MISKLFPHEKLKSLLSTKLHSTIHICDKGFEEVQDDNFMQHFQL
jgi:hypothetical protein